MEPIYTNSDPPSGLSRRVRYQLRVLRRGDPDDPLENEVQSMTHSKLLPKFVHDLSPPHLDERETGGDGEGW